MKFAAQLLFVIATIAFLAGPAAAESWSKRLTREATADAIYAFEIQVDRVQGTDRGDFLQFHVKVKGKDLPELPQRSGELRVFDGEKFVASCDLQSKGPDGARSFTFEVSQTCTGKSTFRYAQHGEFGHISYWFFLQDFVNDR